MSNPLQSPPTDPAELARQLAESENAAPGPLDSTLAELRQQLETLTEQLRRPAPADEFEDESACRRVVEAIGRDPSRSDVRAESAPVADSDVVPAELAQLGQYRLLAKLGQGGMGAVYKALHVRLDKVVAVKVLPQEVTQRADAVARFEREMRAVGKLQHPNIVAAHDAGEANGNHFLVMELVDGEDVGSLVRRRGPLPIAESCEIVRQAALGLQHAHEHGLVHRDIKPSNLMLSVHGGHGGLTPRRSPGELTPGRSPVVKILDMGLALLDESHREAAGELTSTGQIMGTLDYMAPEQGADTHTVDIRADVYSLGATLYKLLCGHAPFEGKKYSSQIKKLTALATVEPERIENLRPDVPQGLADLVHRMLSKTPAARPTPPAEVAGLLAPFAAGADLCSLFDLTATAPDSFSTTAETATDPTFIAETNVAQPATWDGPPGPSATGAATTPYPATAPDQQTLPTPSPLSRANDAAAGTDQSAGEGPGAREQTQASSPPSSILHPPSSSPRPPRRRSLLRYTPFAAPLLIGLAIIVINTKQGTVTVKTSEKLPDAVTIAVKQGGEVVEILDKDNNWKARVAAGEYELEVRGGNDEIKLEQDENGVSRLGVSRWGETIVDLEFKPAAIAAETAPDVLDLNGEWTSDNETISLTHLPRSNGAPFDVYGEYRNPRATGQLILKADPAARTLTGVLKQTGASWNVALEIADDDDRLLGNLKYNQGDLTLVWDFRRSDGSSLDEPRSINFALQFDGVDDYVNIPTLSLAADSPWTLECWYSRADGNPGNLFSYAGGLRLFPGGQKYLNWDARTSTPPHHLREENYWPIEPATGVAVALTFDGQKVRLFADGRLCREWDAPDVQLEARDPNWGNGAAIGANVPPWWSVPYDESYFEGRIDELRISNVARYTADYEVRPRLETDEQTVALYHFDDGQGDVLTDASGNGHHGKIVGATWIGPDGFDVRPDIPTSPSSNFALSFDGRDDGVEVKSLRYDGSHPLTIEGWVHPEGDVEHSYYVVWNSRLGLQLVSGPASDQAYWLGGARLVDSSSVAGFPPRSVPSDSGHWVGRPVHLAIVYDGSGVTLFVDGKAQSRIEGNGLEDVAPHPEHFMLGISFATPPDGCFQGTLDEIRISSTVRYTRDFQPALRFEPDEHTLALYHFDDGQGDVLTDASGNGHHGKVIGATWVPADAPQPASSDLDREIAQWALDQGVAVHIVELAELPVGTELYRLAPEAFYAIQFSITSLPLRLIDDPQIPLPAAPFVVVGIAHAHGREWHEGLRLSADDIRRLGGLRHLQYLSVVAADSAAVAALDSLQQLRILSLDLGQANGGLSTLRSLPELVYLEVHHAGNAAVPEIAAIPALRVLNLLESDIALNDAGLEALAETRLESLAISQADVAGPGLAHLKSVETLRQLALNTVHPSALDSLSELPQLQSLHLARLLDDGRLLKLADLPNVRSVTVYSAEGLTDAGMAAFRSARPDCELLYVDDEATSPTNFALQFDGEGDVVHVAGFHPPIDQPITFECRVTLTAGADHRQANLLVTPLGGLKVNPDNRWSMLVWDRGTQRAALSLIDTQPVETAREYHVAASWDGQTYRLFIDGRLVAEKPLSEIPAAAAGEPVAIGGYPNGATGIAEAVLHGIVDEVRISSAARYTADFEPEPRLQLDAETLALYHFDEGQGVVLNDVSGNNHHGEIIGAAWVSATTDSPFTNVPGKFALKFDGDGDYVQIPWKFDGQTPLTVEAVVSLAGPQTPWGCILTDAQTPGGLNLAIFEGHPHWMVFGTNASAVSAVLADDPLTLPGRVHFAGVYNEGFLTFYINGQPQQGHPQVFGGYAASGLPVLIGANPDPVGDGRQFALSDFFRGVIEELRISSVPRYGEAFTPSLQFEADDHTLALYHFDEGAGDVLRDASGNGHDGQIVGATWVRTGPRPAASGPYDTASERFIAEDVLRAGGNVTIVVPQAPPDAGQLQSYPYGTNLFHQLPLVGQEQSVRSIEQLPAEPFHITRIQLRQQAAIDSSLVESLAGLPFLFELNLEHSAANDGHAAVIGRMPQLRYLNVGATSLTDEGLRELSRLANLRYLAIWSTPGITDAGLEHVARLTNLVEIYLHGNPLITDHGIAFLRDLPHVVWLWLEGTGITDAALETVSGFEELDSLRLSSTKINGSGLTHLARLQKLNWLFLHDTEITDETGVLLKDVQFGSLWLNGTSVGDATLKAIAGRQQIHQLTLNGTDITDAGLAHLKGTRIVHLSANNTALTGSGLAELDIVQVLDLSQTQLTDDAAKSLTRLATLTILNVADTPLSEETVRSLHEALPNCTIYSDFGTFEPQAALERDIAEWVLAVGGKVTVQLAGEEQPRPIATPEALPQEAWQLVGVDLGYTRVTDDDLARLRGAAALQTLNLDSAEFIGDTGLAHLAGLPLTSLDLRNTQVTDGSVPVLQQLPQLSLLSLAHTGVTDAGMAGLARLSQLQHLNVCNNPISDAGLAELRDLATLKSLAAYDTEITDAGLAHVAAMTELDFLHLGDTQVSDAGLIHLSSLKQLRHLYLDGTEVSDAGLVHLAALPNIAALWLEGTQITDAGLQHLRPLTTLGDLFVERTAVTEAGVRQLHADLPACRIGSDFGTVEPEPQQEQQ